MIRICRTTNIELCNELHRELLPGDDLYDSEGAAWWLAYDGDKPVAFAAAKLVAGGSVFLARAGVRRCARGRGLQRRLIRVRERWARAQGATSAVTYADRLNAPSINSLVGAGYRAFDPAEEWGSDSCVYFLKDLT